MLLSQCNHLLVVAELHLERVAVRGDRHVAIAESPDEVEGLARRLLAREAHLVVGDALLDHGAHVRRRAEESVGGHEAFERLVRPLEVVGVDEVRDAPVAVGEVRKHRARQKLVPERLPEPLDLAERLRVLRPALDVSDAVLAKLFLEFRLAAPHRVLPPLVGEDFLRRAVLRDAARERLHHEIRFLVVRERKRDDVTRVIVHEADEVEPLVLAQQKREDVALPELVGLRALEATRRVLARPLRRLLLDEPGLVQDGAHLRLAHAQALEAREHVADPPRAVLGVRLAHLHHGVALGRRLRRRRRRRTRLARDERVEPAVLVEVDPRVDRRERNPEEARHREPRRASLHHLLNHPEPKLDGVRSSRPALQRPASVVASASSRHDLSPISELEIGRRC